MSKRMNVDMLANWERKWSLDICNDCTNS